RILPRSAVDGPGNRAVVFMQGCDFDCCYCHNPETRARCVHCGECVPACPAGALSSRPAAGPDRPFGITVAWDAARCVDCGACVAACRRDSSPKAVTMSAAEVLASLGRQRAFLSGLTVSGGECALQPAFLESLLVASRAAGLPGLVDTNGSTDYRELPGVVEAAEGFMLDVKAWDEAEHRALTGASNRAVITNLRFLAAAGKLYELRTVVVPGRFDAERTVREVSRILVTLGSAARYKLIRFRPQGVRARWRDLPLPDDGMMEALAGLARAEGVREVVVV
ncbi:MAG TPA: YjjW family glycine radical enzyme activase, partial [Spirochaetales bacterium]|nr:YjjW family glycine radical enzyme activase [Spirochaetales bacterium]